MTDTIRRNLSIELRPNRFSEMVGQDVLLSQIRNLLAGTVPAALMFVGAAGCGKTTIAKILARSLNCEHGEIGEPCDACLRNPNFAIIERNAALFTGIDDTRELLNNMGYQPMAGQYRVFILDECQQLSQAAQNLLLKVLEDGVGEFNVFIICTTDPVKILKTVRDRCMIFPVSGLSQTDISRLVARTLTAAGANNGDTDVLADEWAPLVQLLWEREIVSPRNIVMATEKALAGVPFEQAAVAHESGKINIGSLCGALIGGNWEECRNMLKDAEPTDGATIRVVLSGFLRKKLLACNSQRYPEHTKALSECLFELADHNTPEVGIQLSTVCASVYRICQVINVARNARNRAA